ncbi:MAG: hypothetical protein EOP84_13830 [Verrucomicrobiaceae bacterium]|nr:MAG: hypothetical protein EOP84_13830 [Verrucomicrobiaceae bacterium]
MNTHVEDLIAYPQRHFGHPEEVLNEPTLNIDQKRRILESWKLDAQRLAESTAENMSGGEETDLRDVSKALIHLKSLEGMPVARQRKQGSDVTTGMATGALVGAGAGIVISAVTVPSLVLIAQVAAVGMIVGGLTGAVRKSNR